MGVHNSSHGSDHAAVIVEPRADKPKRPEGVIQDFRIRTVPTKLRKRVYTYVPRERMVGMKYSDFSKVMAAYDQKDLGREFLRALG